MNAKVKSRQFCSVCKEWLEMEVVPTGDGDDDDGVIWFRCPQCQGFLPKLSGADLKGEPEEKEKTKPTAKAESGTDDDQMPWDSPADMMAAMKAKDSGEDEDPDDVLLGTEEAQTSADEDTTTPPQDSSVFLPEDTPDETLDEIPDEILDETLDVLGGDLPANLAVEVTKDLDAVDEKSSEGKDEEAEPAEPIMEYAAMLGELDPAESLPYRPWGTYEVGQCIHHLAWDDCGVVVAKENLPGGRLAIKVFFEEAGVVRLIEQAPR